MTAYLWLTAFDFIYNTSDSWHYTAAPVLYIVGL